LGPQVEGDAQTLEAAVRAVVVDGGGADKPGPPQETEPGAIASRPVDGGTVRERERRAPLGHEVNQRIDLDRREHAVATLDPGRLHEHGRRSVAQAEAGTRNPRLDAPRSRRP